MLVVLKSQQQVGERWRLSARRRRDWCRSILRRDRWRTSSSGRSKGIGVHRRVAHENPFDCAQYISRKPARQASLQSAGLCPAHDRQLRGSVAVNLGEFHRLILDLGLGSINFFGVLIAIFVGIGLVSKEIEKKTIYTIVSKPVARYQFLLGKYLGLTITLFVNTVVMALGLLVVLYAQAVPVEGMLFKALALIFVEFMVITAVAPAVFHVYQCHSERHLHIGDICDWASHGRPENVRGEDGRSQSGDLGRDLLFLAQPRALQLEGTCRSSLGHERFRPDADCRLRGDVHGSAPLHSQSNFSSARFPLNRPAGGSDSPLALCHRARY